MAEYDPRVTTVHKSLLLRPTFAGVDKRLGILNITLTAVMAIGITPLVAPIGLINHWLLKWLMKVDPFKMDIYLKANVLDDVYDPWPHSKRKRNSNARPIGYRKDMLC